MKILLLEPFYTGSHKTWCDDLIQFSSHHIELMTLSGHYWKWRMHGGAVSLARKYLASDLNPDLIICTDMLDLSTFLSLTRQRTSHIPTAVYFHENQLTYPWSPTDKDVELNRDNHYAFINYVSALSANHVFYNSNYHLHSFLNELPNFLNGFPDNNEISTIKQIGMKSSVLPLGLNLKKLDEFETVKDNDVPVVLWNHRWEYDKNPTSFFDALLAIKKKGLDFKLVVLGKKYLNYPKVFDEAKKQLASNILHFGFVDSFKEYAYWLWKSDIMPVTSNQDFFGGSVVQAMHCNVYPILPNRLVYKEHIPTSIEANFIYNSQNELESKLEKIIQHKEYLNIKTQPFVVRYDWRNSIDYYDKMFNKISSIKI